MKNFRASVQYGDWKGTVSADEHDIGHILNVLKDRGLADDSDFLVAIDLFLGEMHGDKVVEPYVTAYLVKARNFEEAEEFLNDTPDPLPMKEVTIDVTMEEFLLFFKRLSIAMSKRDLDITDREIQTGN